MEFYCRQQWNRRLVIKTRLYTTEEKEERASAKHPRRRFNFITHPALSDRKRSCDFRTTSGPRGLCCVQWRRVLGASLAVRGMTRWQRCSLPLPPATRRVNRRAASQTRAELPAKYGVRRPPPRIVDFERTTSQSVSHVMPAHCGDWGMVMTFSSTG